MSVFDNYECDGQMSLFDNLETLPEEDMAARIGDALGIKFTYRDAFWGWEYKKKNTVLRIEYARYSIDDHRKHIGCSINHKTSGAAVPCDSVEEAIEWFKKYRDKGEWGI